jgi:hypothetical protein
VRRSRATTAGAIAAAALTIAATVLTVHLVSAPASSDRAVVHVGPSPLRLEPGDPASRSVNGARGAVAAGAPAGSVPAGGAAAPSGVPAATAGDVPIAPPPETFDAPPAPAAPPPAALRAPASAGGARGGGVWAVIIGINDYPGSRSDLRSAVNDANDVNDALSGFGVPGSQRLLIRDRQATAGVVLAAADWLVQHAGPDSTAVFFYAGHVRKLSSSTEAIVAADGRVVTDAQLASSLRDLAARRAWIAMAACFGGGFDEVLAPGRVLTAAADADHLAYENASYGRSYMVQFMVREAMIERRAPDSVQSAYDYARVQLSAQYPGRVPVEYDRAGSPVVLRQSAFAYGGSGPAPPPAGSPPSPPATTAPPSSSDDGRCTNLGVVSVNC